MLRKIVTVSSPPTRAVLILGFTISTILISDVNTLEKTNCPLRCACNKTTIKCVGEELSTIPNLRNIMIYPTVIDLSVNDIEEVKMANFYTKKLEMLQRLQLNDNSIYLIEATAFATLSNLQYLDLSSNLLEDIPYDILRKNHKLTVLRLSENIFGSNPPALVSSSLKILDLSFSKITSFSDNSLKGLPNLEILNLSGNNIKFIDYDIFFNVKLKQINLYANPWECKCDTIKLFNYLVNNNKININKPIQCMHENKQYEDIYKASGPLYQDKLCNRKDEQKVFLDSNPSEFVDSSQFNTNYVNIQDEKNTTLNTSEFVVQTEIIIIVGTIVLVLVLVSLVSLIVVLKKFNAHKNIYAEVNPSFL